MINFLKLFIIIIIIIILSYYPNYIYIKDFRYKISTLIDSVGYY